MTTDQAPIPMNEDTSKTMLLRGALFWSTMLACISLLVFAGAVNQGILAAPLGLGAQTAVLTGLALSIATGLLAWYIRERILDESAASADQS